MEENINSNSDGGDVTQTFWMRNKRIIYIGAAAVILLALLFFGNEFFSSSKFFTQYGGITTNSTISPGDSAAVEPGDSSLNNADIIEALEVKPVEAKPVIQKDSASSSIFSVHTQYDKILPGTDFNNLKATSQEGLFEKLLMPEDRDSEFEKFFNAYRNDKVLSSQSILKILAITGRSILLEHNDADDHLLLQVLTESEKVNGIIIADTEGKIVYATNQKYLDTLIASIMPEIDLSKIKISWHQKESQNIVAIPIFHTYGKIGTAVLITQF